MGGPSVFGSGYHVWSGTATRRSRVLAISGPALRKFASCNAELYPWIVDVLCFKPRARPFGAMASRGRGDFASHPARSEVDRARFHGLPEALYPLALPTGRLNLLSPGQALARQTHSRNPRRRQAYAFNSGGQPVNAQLPEGAR